MDRLKLKQVDPEIAGALRAEARRQRDQLVLIASENYASRAVLEATGSVLTNKYAEGYPGRRYYGGCEHSDTVEALCQARAKALFGAEHVNVQPHSGAQANMAVYLAFLKPGDTILGMNLAQGGHLTHGSPVSFSGILYRAVFYGVGRETGLIDYDEVMAQAQAHHPRLIIAGGSAYPRVIDFQRFRQVADACGALLMVDMAHPAGLIAAGVHPSPVPWAEVVTTTTHKTLRGPRGGMILCRAQYAQAIDKAVFPGVQGGPLMHVIAAKAVALHEAATPEFRAYQTQVVANARALAEALLARGYRLISGGTDTHLVLVDLTPTGLTGKEAEAALASVGVVVNKNAIPYDTRPPAVAGGIRLGTPIVTTRGMREKEMEEIAEVIHLALARSIMMTGGAKAPRAPRRPLRARIRALCRSFPV